MINDNPNIIIVDDDDIITESISTYFDLTTDYNVITFNCPELALTELKGKAVDVIISDFMMPGMNGLEFLSYVKDFCPDAVMILLTGYADKDNAIKAINELELYQYIEKPWDNEELVMVVKNGLDKKNLIIKLTEKVAELKTANETILNQNDEITHLYELLKKDYENEIESVENVIVALAKTIEAKDTYTVGHTDRVSNISYKIGKRLNLDEQKLKILKIGGMVHDIGKIAVPEHILNKPGRLTKEEFEIIQQHPVIGEKICKPLKSLSYVLSCVRQHHEKLNGSGYPDSLTSEEIKFEAKVIAVADVYDAITSTRPYRKKMPKEQAREILESEKNNGNLDALIVDTLFELVEEGIIE